MKLVLSTLLLISYFVFSSLFDMQMLQQNSYNGKCKYFIFLKNDIKNHFIKYLSKLLFGVLLLFAPDNWFVFIIIIILFCIYLYQSLLNYLKYSEKLPLKYTSRLKRIMFIDYLLFLVIILFNINNIKYLLGFGTLYIAINSLVLSFIVFMLKPVEKLIFNHYKKEALTKLSKMRGLNIIGITGSFGKTSTKLILDSILKTRYKGFVTPASFNTPNGILMTINKEDTIFNDYFICEMGARKTGEIKELCDLVYPKYGILTSIGKAHLESFKSLENIQKTKFELIESLPEDGVAILNKDDEYQRKYQLKNKCKVIWIGIEKDADVMASNIKIDNNGTTFDVYIKGQKEKLTVNTILIGDKNVYNILASIALAFELKVPFTLIKKGVKNIAPIEHRLQLKKIGNLTILDDAYNANPKGAKMALDALKNMEGKKIVITPGMVEMGKEEDKLNFEFGRQMAVCADKVYLIGKRKTKAIYDGLINNKFKKENIVVVNKFKDAYNDATMNTGKEKLTILIENDLPDSYMEE